MIFVTLGTQSCDFSRCTKMIDELVSKHSIKEPIIAQIGHTAYKPQGVKCFDFVSEQEYQRYIREARVIISHAGTGALFSSISKGKKVIAVARLHKYGEMINDHQTEIVKKLSEEGFILNGTNSIAEVWKELDVFMPTQLSFKNAIVEAIDRQLAEWLKSATL